MKWIRDNSLRTLPIYASSFLSTPCGAFRAEPAHGFQLLYAFGLASNVTWSSGLHTGFHGVAMAEGSTLGQVKVEKLLYQGKTGTSVTAGC